MLLLTGLKTSTAAMDDGGGSAPSAERASATECRCCRLSCMAATTGCQSTGGPSAEQSLCVAQADRLWSSGMVMQTGQVLQTAHADTCQSSAASVELAFGVLFSRVGSHGAPSCAILHAEFTARIKQRHNPTQAKLAMGRRDCNQPERKKCAPAHIFAALGRFLSGLRAGLSRSRCARSSSAPAGSDSATGPRHPPASVQNGRSATAQRR